MRASGDGSLCACPTLLHEAPLEQVLACMHACSSRWLAPQGATCGCSARIPARRKAGHRHAAPERQVAQYAFTFPNASGGADAAYLRYMFPAGDLLNHAGDSNAACGRDFRTGMLYAKATRAIRRAPRPRRFRGPAGGAPPGVACRSGDRGCPGRRGRAAEAARGRPPARLRGRRGRAGEEVTHTYDAGLERNDVALINHFFVQDLRPPRLCALDLPAGRLDGVLGAPDASYLPRLDDELEVRRARALPGAGARRQGRAPAARAVALHRRGAACGRAVGGCCA